MNARLFAVPRWAGDDAISGAENILAAQSANAPLREAVSLGGDQRRCSLRSRGPVIYAPPFGAPWF